MISEVGVYKTTEGMEKANPIPKGMEVIDVTDTDLEDKKDLNLQENGIRKINRSTLMERTHGQMQGQN